MQVTFDDWQFVLSLLSVKHAEIEHAHVFMMTALKSILKHEFLLSAGTAESQLHHKKPSLK